MVNSSSSPTTKAVRDGNSQPIPTSPSLSFGISWKDKYISKEKRRNALLKNRTLTSPPDPTKAGSAQEYPPKSRHQQPDGNNPRFCKGSCQADRTDRTTSRQLGRFCRHPHPLRILAGTGKQAARPFRIYSPRRKVRFRPIVSKLRKMGDKPPCTLNRTVKVLYPMNKV